MKALVINLDTAVDRMEFQTKQLNSLGIEFEHLSATSVEELEDGIYQQYYSTWERPLRKTEVACFLSHKNAWGKVLKHNVPMLILEDDAYISHSLPCILDTLESQSDIDFVTLEVRGRKKIIAKVPSYKFCNVSLIRLYQDRTGAAGYVLWPSGAKKLIERFKKGNMAIADAFISSTYSLNMYQIEPAVIIQHDQCEYYGLLSDFKTKSSVSSLQREHIPVTDYFFYRLKRLIGQFKLGVRRIRVLSFSTKRHLLLSSYFEKKGPDRGEKHDQ